MLRLFSEGRPSNDSLHYLRLVHQGRTNCWRLGATIPGHTRPIRPIVIAVFSNRVFGVFGLKIFNGGSDAKMQWSGQPVDDGDQGVEDGWDVAGHVVAQLDRDLARRPGGVVAHADVLRVQVARKDRHEL